MPGTMAAFKNFIFFSLFWAPFMGKEKLVENRSGITTNKRNPLLNDDKQM